MSEPDRRTRIEERLREGLAAVHIEVEDESHLHAGHAGARGGAGHYRALIVGELAPKEHGVAFLVVAPPQGSRAIRLVEGGQVDQLVPASDPGQLTHRHPLGGVGNFDIAVRICETAAALAERLR